MKKRGAFHSTTTNFLSIEAEKRCSYNLVANSIFPQFRSFKRMIRLEFLYEYNAVVRFITLPCKVKAFTIFDDENEFYNIYVNEKLSNFEKKKAIKHELEHIEKGHFKSNYEQNVNEIEWGMSG